MPATFDRELRRLLQRAGCTFVRAGKGSHQIWYSPITEAPLSGADRDRQPAYRERHPEPSRFTKGFLSRRALARMRSSILMA